MTCEISTKISSQICAAVLIEKSGRESMLNEDSIDKEFRTLHFKLKDPKCHDLEISLQNVAISSFVRCTKLEHKLRRNPLWIAGKRTTAETDTALPNRRNERVCALVQIKRTFEAHY